LSGTKEPLLSNSLVTRSYQVIYPTHFRESARPFSLSFITWNRKTGRIYFKQTFKINIYNTVRFRLLPRASVTGEKPATNRNGKLNSKLTTLA